MLRDKHYTSLYNLIPKGGWFTHAAEACRNSSTNTFRLVSVYVSMKFYVRYIDVYRMKSCVINQIDSFKRLAKHAGYLAQAFLNPCRLDCYAGYAKCCIVESIWHPFAHIADLDSGSYSDLFISKLLLRYSSPVFDWKLPWLSQQASARQGELIAFAWNRRKALHKSSQTQKCILNCACHVWSSPEEFVQAWGKRTRNKS